MRIDLTETTTADIDRSDGKLYNVQGQLVK